MKTRTVRRSPRVAPSHGTAVDPSSSKATVAPFPSTVQNATARMGADFDVQDTRDLTSDILNPPSETRLANAPVPSTADETKMQRIAERAYLLYLARGDQDGDAVTDWLTAERQIEEEIE